MGLLIDCANYENVKEALSWGLLEGVTTNPSLVAKEGGNTLIVCRKLVSLKPSKIFAQVKFATLKEMELEALKLHAVSPSKIIVKIPFSKEGLKLVPILKRKRVKTCLTAIFSASQGFMAAAAKAEYLAVYVGRITKNGGDGIRVVRDISDIICATGLKSRILAASIPDKAVAESLLMIKSVDLTAPLRTLEEMLRHPLTEEAIDQFGKV